MRESHKVAAPVIDHLGSANVPNQKRRHHQLSVRRLFMSPLETWPKERNVSR